MLENLLQETSQKTFAWKTKTRGRGYIKMDLECQVVNWVEIT